MEAPFICEPFLDYALAISVEYKTRFERRKLIEKWILRKAIENELPGSILWQFK